MEIQSLLGSFFDQRGFMPHGHCYLWAPELVGIHTISDIIIGLAYVSISLTLYALVRKIKLPFSGMFLAFGLFIFACGATHFMEVWTTWRPDYWASALIKFVTASASIATAVYLFPLSPQVVRVAGEAKLAEQNRLMLAGYSKELERRVQERTAELEAALRLRDEFISVAAHELRTPLTTVQMRLEIIRRQLGKLPPDEVEKVRRAVEAAWQQTHRLTGLTDTLLNISRLTTGKFEIRPVLFDLAELLEAMEGAFQHQAAQAGSRISLQISQRPLLLTADPVRIEQVIGNLVSNAVRYGKGSPIEILATANDESVIFGVRDAGIGVPEGHLERIFERFERATADNAKGGLGLGLFIARQIVELHGGTITVESKPGEGAEFTVTLPRRSQAGNAN